jgi:hypothetical protein
MIHAAPCHAAVAALLIGAACTGPESPGDKREWSILQVLEEQTRSQTTSRLQFTTVDGYEIMGVPRQGDGRIIWVMLRPAHGARYKQMPEGNFTIQRRLLSELSGGHRVSSTVAAALRGHLAVSDPDAKSQGAAEQRDAPDEAR